MSEMIVNPIGQEAISAITPIRHEDGELNYGNVVRRACELFGKEACQQVCQLRERDHEQYQTIENKLCADRNLEQAIEELGLNPKDVLMVGVTGNEVGFGDKLVEYKEAGKLKTNPAGWRELPGFNAFFVRTSEVPALGRRLADCADVNFEFTDTQGNTVIGFEHGTRTDMFGSKDYPFERNSKKVSFTEYALGNALDHYGADPRNVKIRLTAAIQGHNFIKRFDSVQKMEEHLPGWYYDGFVENMDNPDRVPDKDGSLDSNETWAADTRGLIIKNIKDAMKKFDIPEENFSMEGLIDPADSGGRHSSHEQRELYGIDTRDLYITYVN